MDNKPKFLREDALQRCKKYRYRILDIAKRLGDLYIAPAFSCLEITDIIYHHLIRVDQHQNFLDTLIMSKGYGRISQYVILHDLGYLSDEELFSCCKSYIRFEANREYGLQGLEIAVGIALANRLQKIESYTYVILSENEMQNSPTWETIKVAANLRLTNLIVFLDWNELAKTSFTSINHPAFYPIVDKLLDCGWYLYDVDGHNSEKIYDAAVQMDANKPTFIICNTSKEKEVSHLENFPRWHYSSDKTEYKQAKSILKATKIA